MTQIIERSREVEEQKRHGSTSVRLLQTEQETILRFTSSSAPTKRSTSVSVIRSTWKASRCAVFCPMPGRRLNSSMSLVTGSEYSSMTQLRNADFGLRIKASNHFLLPRAVLIEETTMATI